VTPRLAGLVLVAGLAGLAAGRWLVPATTPRRPAAGPAAAKRLWTCGMHPQVLRDAPGNCPICGMELTPVETGRGPGVTIDPAVVQNMGVRTATVVEDALRTTVRAAGALEEAEPARHDVNLRVSGWVTRLYANVEGIHVTKGMPLFELYSPEVQVAVGELIAARRAGAPLYATVAGKLRLWDLQPAEIERLAALERAPETVTFTSPVNGHVVVKSIVEGGAVQAGQQVLRIVDHSSLWLTAQVFEQQLPLVRLGQPATATLPAMPGRVFTGEVLFVHPHVDPMTRTAMVRFVIPNPDLALRPGMYATVEIAAEVAARALLVPRESVIDTGTRRVVFLAREAGHFEPREVTTGATGNDGMVQVLSGLAAGETVVTSGQFLLDAESRFQEAIQKHLGHAGTP
jgi:multidrug efflux pump subunit AcrA (membrane-fusion protein)